MSPTPIARPSTGLGAGTVRRAGQVVRAQSPDATHVSCGPDSLDVGVPEGDFRVRVRRTRRDTAQLEFQVVFREDRPAGGTWWASWEVGVDLTVRGAELGEIVAREIRRSRDSFAYALRDDSSPDAAGSRPRSHAA